MTCLKLKKVNILKRRNEITLVLKEGKKKKGSYVECKILKKEKERKVAFFIKKASEINAVKRNKIKRMMRECYRKNISFFEGRWVIFFGKKDILKTDKKYHYLCNEMKKLNMEEKNEKNIS